MYGGGKLPQESAQRLKKLVPVSSGNLLWNCRDNFLNEIKMSGFDVQEELSVPLNGTKVEQLRNDYRDHTVAFYMHPNRNPLHCFNWELVQTIHMWMNRSSPLLLYFTFKKFGQSIQKYWLAKVHELHQREWWERKRNHGLDEDR